jgi:II/X family phage/plasmid replication protein
MDGVLRWEKESLDFDSLRSDTCGICWQMQRDSENEYLVIGASPASLKHGLNVFGNLDILDGAKLLIKAAQNSLNCILPPLQHWQCRRIDITGNYLLPDAISVKQALRMLMSSDAARRKASSMKSGGDSVMWNSNSDLVKGKAYHKGPQISYLLRKHPLPISAEQLDYAYRLLRLEHTRAARWFRRLEDAGERWQDLNPERLAALYVDFFGRLVDGTVEIKDMQRDSIVSRLMDENGISEGRAQAAYTTLRNIREDGYLTVKDYMTKTTFYRHMSYLRKIGITDSDLHLAKVIPLRPVKIILAQPVASWDDIRRVA